MDAREAVTRAMNIHGKIAGDVCEGKVAAIMCHTCGSSQDVSPQQFGQYLALGWPVCHGQTMELRLRGKE